MTHLPGQLPDVFAFFKDPNNLAKLTPPWLGFTILDTTDAEVRQGTEIRYKISLLGIPLTWHSRITAYEENSHFADEQLSGPYTAWFHSHAFQQLPDGVQMTDTVAYRLPFGQLGRLVHWLVVRHQLRAIFDYRTTAIAEHLR
ncbi:MAG TPA: SRPBCC family protein [Gemmatimonadales bacterium]|nr:SRPBCC family protein [Gemmatimonadales bacterium]